MGPHGVVLALLLACAMIQPGCAMTAATLAWDYGAAFPASAFPTVPACVGDQIEFLYGGYHNVWSLTNGECNFTGAVQVGPDDVSITADVPLPAAGTYHFACYVEGHCEYGAMNVQVDVGTCAGGGQSLPPTTVRAAPPPPYKSTIMTT